MSEKRKVIIFTGGTMVHVSPHFSLCAPAFGTVGTDIAQELFFDFDVTLYSSYMAGGRDFNTNEDLKALLKKILKEAPENSIIIMAAAVCDFRPQYLRSDGYCTTQFGKDQPRLSSDRGLALDLVPAEKLVQGIKKKRPDITLVTFKTTAGESWNDLIKKAGKNIEATGADLVFANDIVSHLNALVFPTATLKDSRKNLISVLKHYI